MSPQTTIFFGLSGAGKGTQAKLLREYLERSDPSRRVLYFGTGVHVRKFVDKYHNHTSALAKNIIDAGKLLPSFMPIWLWSDFLIKNYTGVEHLIFDGTRLLLEISALDTALSFYNIDNPQVIVLVVSKEWSVKRLQERGRADDLNEKDIDSRLSWYKTGVIPTVNFLRKNSKYKVHDINGEQSIETVHKDILHALAL